MKKRILRISFLSILFIGCAYLWWNPFGLKKPIYYSIALLDRNKNLLSAQISQDGQWRFQSPDSLPDKYIQSLLTFEDKRFYYHLGVDPISLLHALWDGCILRKKMRGASTLTMQVIRIYRHPGKRSFFAKLNEVFRAFFLELRYSKNEILRMYASEAPYGGNVCGITAACWRYFNKDIQQLSWAEAALLTVLPNNPSQIHVTKNRLQLQKKRNALLYRLFQNQVIDHETYQLACAEWIPEQPYTLPQLAPHLLQYIKKKKQFILDGRPVITTIDQHLQELMRTICDTYHASLSESGVNNLSCVVIDNRNRNVLVYLGNASQGNEDQFIQNDMVTALRSYGSLLKPFLFAAALDEGILLPSTLLKDVPSYFGSYSPSNFTKQFSGMVPADQALAQSINVPWVHTLKEYGVSRFMDKLKQCGMTTLQFSPDHYGLALILGGGEGNLLNLSEMYSHVADVLIHFGTNSSSYSPLSWKSVQCIDVHRNSTDTRLDAQILSPHPQVLSAGACYATVQALTITERPDVEDLQDQFRGQQKIAWKTGTSYGSRDAWCIGITPGYTVGVWMGNASGKGCPGLTGVKKAAPLMFDVMNRLPVTGWFPIPYDAMEPCNVCQVSGNLASPQCPVDSQWIPKIQKPRPPCTYHIPITLDFHSKKRITPLCQGDKKITHQVYFHLPPKEEYYYKLIHPDYQQLPDYHTDCPPPIEPDAPLKILYPEPMMTVHPARDLSGVLQQVICKAALHRKGKMYWSLDNQYLKTTEGEHVCPIQPTPGVHILTIQDEYGNLDKVNFHVRLGI